jgi:H+-transporting ATPase
MAQAAAIDLSKPTAAGPAPAGLTTSEAERRRAVYGVNAIAAAAPRRWPSFLAKFWSPVPWMLEAAIVLQLWLGQYVEAAVVGGLLLFNATLAFIQEGRAGAALAALKKRLSPTALVRRDGDWKRRPASELVPGDIIRLPLGAVVPADATVMSGSVMVDQSALTGESAPVDAEPGSKLFAGSMVRRGQAVAEVTATGAKTYFGRTAELVRVAHATSTEQRAIFAVTRNLALINGIVAALIIAAAYRIGLPAADQVRLALTALLATVPLALPATFTLSAALSARLLAQRGVLLSRLTAAHEAAAMDILCADKTGTLTVNTLEVADVLPTPGYTAERVLALAALASSEADQDPIDAAIRAAAKKASAAERLSRFVPFDPASKRAEAVAVDRDGHDIHIVKGAFEVVAPLAPPPADAERRLQALAGNGRRVIAVAAGAPDALRFCGLIALSDPPREDSKELVGALRAMNVRTVMVTGDSAATAATVAGEIGIAGDVCPAEGLNEDIDACGVFARVTPEEKYRLVQALQHDAHVVGMCGDGVNDAPALRQAQIGVAVSTATDVAKAAAAMVLTEPGLAGVVAAVREGRVGFQRLLAFVFNMLVKKTEIVLFLAIGLALTGHGVLTPALMVLLFVTNDFLAMSLTTDRASPALHPSVWRMRNITAAAVTLGACKLAFSTAILAAGKFRLGFGPAELQTLAFVTLVFGNQAVLFVLRERRSMWRSRPSNWIVAASVAGIAIAAALALSGTLMEPLEWRVLAAVFVAAVGFALILDQIKQPVTALFKVG